MDYMRGFQNRKKRHLIDRLAAATLAFLFCAAILTSGTPAALAAGPRIPADIRGECTFQPSSNSGSFGLALDDSTNDAWVSAAGPQTLRITVNAENPDVRGFYFRWSTAPTPWKMYALTATGERKLIDMGGFNGWMCEFSQVPADDCDAKTFELESEGPLAIADMNVFSVSIPEYVPRWMPAPKKVDMLVFSAHPDDETVFLGAPALTAMNQGKSVMTAYMTWGQECRKFEANEACWMLGEKYAPDMRPSPDVRAMSLDGMEQYWPLDKAVGFMVEEIRKYRPSVIVTHDVNGEYGHGAHRETSYAATIAFGAAGDPTKYPDSAARYGAWMPGKLYLHLFKQDQIHFDIDAPLSAHGGKKLRDTVLDAFMRHKSQTATWRPYYDGPLSMKDLGLCLSNVGPDVGHTSMFENISAGTMSDLNCIAAPVPKGQRQQAAPALVS